MGRSSALRQPALLKRAKILIFDEAISKRDQPSAERFARTINQLKRRVTMPFITQQNPRGLQVEVMFSFDCQQHVTKLDLVGKDKCIWLLSET